MFTGEMVPTMLIELVLMLPSLVAPVVFFIIAFKKRNDEIYDFYKFAIVSLLSALVSVWGIYNITIGPGSHDAQSAVGFVFLPFLSFGFAIISLLIIGFLRKFFQASPVVNAGQNKNKFLFFPGILILVSIFFLLYESYNGSFGYLAETTRNKELITSLEKRAHESNDTVIMIMLAQNRNTPTDVLERLASYAPDYILIHVSSNPNTPIDLIQNFVNSDNKVLSKFARENLEKRMMGNNSPANTSELTLVFSSKASQLKGFANSYAEEKNLFDTVEVEFPGQLYPRSRAGIPVTEKSFIDRSTPENLISSIYSANKAGDKEWIIENFVSDEQNDRRTMLNDSTVFQRNSDFMHKVKNEILLAKLFYGQYVILMVSIDLDDGTQTWLPYTLTKEGNEWKQTNKLSSDDKVGVIFAAAYYKQMPVVK